jgi:hypothetical protein
MTRRGTAAEAIAKMRLAATAPSPVSRPAAVDLERDDDPTATGPAQGSGTDLPPAPPAASPVTTAPATEAPATEAPATEAPATEAPAATAPARPAATRRAPARPAAAARPAEVTAPPAADEAATAPPGRIIRITLDLGPGRYQALRLYSATHYSKGAEVLRALLDELDRDPQLAATVARRITDDRAGLRQP